MPRSRVRAAVRPDPRRELRRFLLPLAAAIATFGWATVAAAQGSVEAEASASSAVVSVLEAPRSALLATASRADDAVQTGIGSRTATPSTTAAAIGPVLSSSAVRYVPSADRAVDREVLQDGGVGLGSNLALVIVGLAAMIIGSDVDDAPGTLLVVGGAGMTLYGMYNILR
jgi:hypothetical protein